MKVSPRGDWIIGLPIEVKDERVSGLYMTDGQKYALENRPMLTVIEVGPDVNKPAHCAEAYKPSGREIKVGDVLIYDREGMRRVEGKDTKAYVMVLVQAIIGHLESDEEGNPAEVAERKKFIESVQKEVDEKSQRKVRPGIVPVGVVPNPAAMRGASRLVQAAGR